MKKPKTQFCFKVWDSLVHKWYAGGHKYSKNGKTYSKKAHALSSITNRLKGRLNNRKREEFQIRHYKLVEITEQEYKDLKAENHERRNS